MAFGLLFLKKALILGGIVGAPVALVFSDFFSKGATLEVMSNEDTPTTGPKKVAILVSEDSKIHSVDLNSLKCEDSKNHQKLLGIGLLSEINSKQVSGGLIKDGLVAVGCGKNNKLEVIGKSENFWYGVLDYEKVVIELLKDETGKKGNESENILKSYDKCGEKLKKNFKYDEINLSSDLFNCGNEVFNKRVMTIWAKNGTTEDQWETGNSGWGEFKGAYGDRLSNIEVGDGKIRTSNGKIFNEFPRKMSLKTKNNKLF